MSYIPIRACQVQERICPRFRSARYENVPNSNQLGRKRPRFRSARTRTSQIPISKDENVPDSDEISLVLMRSSAIFRKIREKLRLGQKYAELCGEWIIMRNCAKNRKLCDIALTALKCCLCSHKFILRLVYKDRPGPLFQPGPGPGPGSAKSAGTGILPGPGL